METYLQDLGMEISLEASKIKGFGRKENKANEVQIKGRAVLSMGS